MDQVWRLADDGQVTQHELYQDRFWRPYVTDIAKSAAIVSTNGDERDDYIWRGLNMLESAVGAVNPDRWSNESEFKLRGWRHQSVVSIAHKKHGEPYIMVREVEDAASEYLDLPYRVEALDRLLADMLIASEMLAFMDEMKPKLKQSPTIGSWLWNNIKSAIIGLSIAGVVIWLAPESTVAAWISGIVATLTVLGTGLSLILFPFFYPDARAQRLKIKATLMSMVDAYATLQGSPASVGHVRKAIDKGTDTGVVWPAPLMVLFDDIAERRKTV